MDFCDSYPRIWDIYNDSNLAQIQEFLKSGGDPNLQFYCGVTLLHRAVNIPFDNIQVVRELIKSGADVNVSCHLDITPLHNAVLYRKRYVIDELIQSGASVTAKDFLGKTVLHLAVTRWLLPVSRALFSFQHDIFVINKLLKHERIDCNAVDLNGETPLMLAVKDNNLDIVMMLLDDKADPNICNNDLQTPLHVAFTQPLGYIQIKLLLCGANIYSVNKYGETPLDILLQKCLNNQWNEWVIVILKVIAFKYSVTSDLKRKFEVIPHISQFFKKCCNEVDHMRRDFIAGNLTVHDFVWNCFDDNDFKHLLSQIHRPLVDRLVRDVYIEYFIEILDSIPNLSLFTILQMTACLKKHAKPKEKRKTLADLFSILDVVYLFSKHLRNVDVLCLIVAFSDVMDPKPKTDLYDSNILSFFD